MTQNRPEVATETQPIFITEVTLRDGMQQDNIQHSAGEFTSIEDRLAVFDALVGAGMERIEIGHLGNEDGQDIAFARKLVSHINDAKSTGDTRYDNVKLQVLFGSQKDLIERGVEALEGFDKNNVIVHVYDRISPNLRHLATEDYTGDESAYRIIDAAEIALGHGFKHFSISGEGATDPDLDIDEVVGFYTTVTDALLERGAKSVNCNLANTFGYSVTDETFAELAYFNANVKAGRPSSVTTSIHVHNDYNDAPGYAITAIRAGFDRIEGTMIGMGERAGNVAIADVIVRLLEDARSRIDRESRGTTMRRLGSSMVQESIWDSRFIEPSVIKAYAGMYAACATIANIFGTQNRWYKTSLGNPEAYDAGSGPHAHANREYLRDPNGKPLWRNYGSSALVHAILGRPEAIQIIEVDPKRIQAITIQTHAAGGSTNQVLTGEVVAAPEAERHQSVKTARAMIEKITSMTSETHPFQSKLEQAIHA